MLPKTITALMLIIGSCVLVQAGGVTNIKEVINKSSKPVRVSCYDNKTLLENGHRNMLTTSVIASGGDWRGEMWVPWADNKNQFRSHFFSVEIFDGSPARAGRVQIFGGYQTGEEIRSSLIRTRTTNQGEVHYLVEDEYNASAPRVEGEWRSGGDRRIVFFDRPDHTVGFKFERLGR
ncbi:MAG TPA: hypothetical protein VMZ26_11020 [Pyrinomonadaceae bacterium]|nr:hypothetical protein [Pyrinomonadaceae bacterium]